MFEQDNIKHHIEKSIVGHLTLNEYARFRDMRPMKVDTNLFAYHLKALIKSGFVKKTEKGYTLDRKGLVYVDRANAQEMKLRSQPKIITMLLVQDESGNVLLQQRSKQPYINTWTLPYGKLHIDDISVIEAAIRESKEKLGYTPKALRHIGDCYIVTVKEGEEIIETRTLAHIVRFDTSDIQPDQRLKWVKPGEINSLTLAPAVEQIIAKVSFNGNFFFEEFRVPVQ